MTKLKVLKVINSILFLAFCIQTITGIVLAFNISIIDIQSAFLIHKYCGLLMVFLVFAHLALNWGWIKINIFNRHPENPNIQRGKN